MNPSEVSPAMTAEERVKANYPDAEMYLDLAGGFAVGSTTVGKTIGDGKSSRGEAWIDAARRLPASPVAEGESQK